MMPPLEPLDFLSLAQELANLGGEERLRTAIGRAYYALFLLAPEKTGAFPIKKDDSPHAMVIRAVRKRKGFAVANDLYDLKELRIVADYELLPTDPTERDWAKNWSTAQALIKRLLPRLRTL